MIILTIHVLGNSKVFDKLRSYFKIRLRTPTDLLKTSLKVVRRYLKRYDCCNSEQFNCKYP